MHAQLEVLATYTLFGNVQSMAATRLRNTERDTLFLTFNDAKLSVVEYDPSNHDLKTVSEPIHASLVGVLPRSCIPKERPGSPGLC
jgi:hypothetical protein